MFEEGDLVLRKILPIHKDPYEKWIPNYKGPYIVKKAFSGGALILTTMDRTELPGSVESDAVKKPMPRKEDKILLSRKPKKDT